MINYYNGQQTLRFQRRARGFTLIELAVVVLVLSVVIAIVLPAIAAGREAARQTKCLANLSGLASVMVSYASQHNQFPLMEVRSNVANAESRGPRVIDSDIPAGVLPTVMKCPSDDSGLTKWSSYSFVPAGLFTHLFERSDFVPPSDDYGIATPREVWASFEADAGTTVLWRDSVRWHLGRRQRASKSEMGTSYGMNFAYLDGSCRRWTPR